MLIVVIGQATRGRASGIEPPAPQEDNPALGVQDDTEQIALGVADGAEQIALGVTF